MKVVRDDHPPELAVREREGRAILQIPLEQLDTPSAIEILDAAQVAVDAGDAVA